MPGVLVIAVDAFAGNQALEARHRFASGIKQLSPPCFAVTRDERGRIDLQAREHLTAVARARAPSDPLALDDKNCRASSCELSRRGETGIACADDDRIKTA